MLCCNVCGHCLVSHKSFSLQSHYIISTFFLCSPLLSPSSSRSFLPALSQDEAYDEAVPLPVVTSFAKSYAAEFAALMRDVGFIQPGDAGRTSDVEGERGEASGGRKCGAGGQEGEVGGREGGKGWATRGGGKEGTSVREQGETKGEPAAVI